MQQKLCAGGLQRQISSFGGSVSKNIRCPVKACSGWVCEVEDSPNHTFFGCGECGNVWWKKSELDQAISQAIEKSPYRAQSYLNTEQGWIAQPLKLEDPDFDQKVRKEWGQ